MKHGFLKSGATLALSCILALALIFTVPAYKSHAATKRAKAAAAALRADAVVNYDQLAELSAVYPQDAKQSYLEKTPNQKRAYWDYRLGQIPAGALNAEQQAFVDEFVAKLPSLKFDGTDSRDDLKPYIDKSHQLFSKDLGAIIFSSLNDVRLIKAGYRVECDCATYDDWCGGGHWCVGGKNGCIPTIFFGCGLALMFSCDGMCSDF